MPFKALGPALALILTFVALVLVVGASSAPDRNADDAIGVAIAYVEANAAELEVTRADAERLGISAAIQVEPGAIRVELRGEAPEALFVHLAHATRAGHDMRLRLARAANGTYHAELPALPAGRWRAVIEDAQGRWRLVKEVS